MRLFSFLIETRELYKNCTGLSVTSVLGWKFPLGAGLFRQLWKISWLSLGSIFLADTVDTAFVQCISQTNNKKLTRN